MSKYLRLQGHKTAICFRIAPICIRTHPLRPFNGAIRTMSSTDGIGVEWTKHREIVKSISKAVEQFHENGQKFRIAHGSSNSTRDPRTKGTNFVDTSKLQRVLSIDTKSKIAMVEPNVPMDRLVEATLPHGLVPPVVMEFPGITAGGGFAGTSGESSTFSHGFFDRNINRAEIVLGNGQVVEATRNEHADLLHGAAGAVGTFGITTLMEIQLVDTKKYVLTKYHPVSSVNEAIEVINEAMADPKNDYIDGILYSRSEGAIISGALTDNLDGNTPIQTFSAASDPWFYLHVQKRIREAKKPVYEALPLAEYLFRYDRGGFWVGESAFKYLHFPFNQATRWFLDDFLHTRMLYKSLHAANHASRFLVQDLALPFDAAAEFIDYVHDNLHIYPLWLCPLRQSPQPTMHPHHLARDSDTGELKPLLNIGVWGYGPRKRHAFVEANRQLEAKLRELGGMKWLYANQYYTEEEFWAQFDRPWYDALRKKYHATNLPDVYEKVRVQVDADEPQTWRERIMDIPLVSAAIGLRSAIASKAYREARASTWKHQS